MGALTRQSKEIDRIGPGERLIRSAAAVSPSRMARPRAVVRSRNAGDRPAFLVPGTWPGDGRSDGGHEPAQRRRSLRAGVEGAEPPASPMSDIG